LNALCDKEPAGLFSEALFLLSISNVMILSYLGRGGDQWSVSEGFERFEEGG
jgi:hypothetical protein